MNLKLRLKLKGKLLLPILGIVILGIASLQGFSYWKSSSILEEDIKTAITRDVSSANRSIDQWINTTVGTLKNWGRNSVLILHLTGTPVLTKKLQNLQNMLLRIFLYMKGSLLSEQTVR